MARWSSRACEGGAPERGARARRLLAVAERAGETRRRSAARRAKARFPIAEAASNCDTPRSEDGLDGSWEVDSAQAENRAATDRFPIGDRSVGARSLVPPADRSAATSDSGAVTGLWRSCSLSLTPDRQPGPKWRRLSNRSDTRRSRALSVESVARPSGLRQRRSRGFSCQKSVRRCAWLMPA
jgi:hypothetical protein